MANVIIDDTYLTGIANAIRTKTGGSDTYTPAQMATAIGNISTSGGGNNNTLLSSLLREIKNFSIADDTSTYPSMVWNGDFRKVPCMMIISVSTAGNNGTGIWLYTANALRSYVNNNNTDGKIKLIRISINTGSNPSVSFDYTNYILLSDLQLSMNSPTDTTQFSAPIYTSSGGRYTDYANGQIHKRLALKYDPNIVTFDDNGVGGSIT